MNELTSPGRRVAAALARIYRPNLLWFWGVLLCCMVVVEVIVQAVDDDRTAPSIWLLVVGNGAKFWMLVIGIMLVTVHLKAFVAHGITRRAYTGGAAAFGAAMAVLFSVCVAIGHLVEWAALRSADALPAEYPVMSAGEFTAGSVRYLALVVAYLVCGWLMGLGYYRFRPLVATTLLVPFVLPLLLAEFLVGQDEGGEKVGPQIMPYGPAVLLTLVVSAAGFVVVRRMLSDVAIRRTAG